MASLHTQDGLGIGIGLGIPLVEKLPLNDALTGDNSLKVVGSGALGLGHPHMRWPYSTRYRSTTYARTGGYDSSPTPSSSSSSSSSSGSEFSAEKRTADTSATHDVLLSYLSPALSAVSSNEGDATVEKVYLLSSGLKQPTHRRCKSETFKFPLPPAKTQLAALAKPLKSALRSTTTQNGARHSIVSPPLRHASGAFRRSLGQLSPQLEQEESDASDAGEARQGWSPYSSAAPTPRQLSGSYRYSFPATQRDPPEALHLDNQPIDPERPHEHTYMSPPSSCSSRTLVSDTDLETETDSGTETDPSFSTDAAKLARLHASLFLLDSRVSELPLSLAQPQHALCAEDSAVIGVGGSVEEKMAYLCGLGYRYRKASARSARKASGEFASQKAMSAAIGDWSDEKPGAGEEVKQGRVESYAPRLVGVHKAVRVVSTSASAVTSSEVSPILSGLFAASFNTADKEEEVEEEEGDVTIKPMAFLSEPSFDGSLEEEFSYLVDQALASSQAGVGETVEPKREARMEGGWMSPPLTTPELGLDGGSPVLLDRWPSPLQSTYRTASHVVEELSGCRPFSASSSVDPFRFSLSPQPRPHASLSSSKSCPTSMWTSTDTTDRGIEGEHVEEGTTIAQASRTTFSPAGAVSVLTRPRPLRASHSNTSLFSSASSDTLQKPAAPAGSVLSRARPVPPREGDAQRFATKSASRVGKTTTTTTTKQARRTAMATAKLPKSKSMCTTAMVVKVPQRKSSLDVRAEAELHRRAEEALQHIVHPNSVSRDAELERRFYSSASAYLPCPPREQLQERKEGRSAGEKDMCTSAAAAARVRRGRVMEEGSMTKSFSLPVLFTARTPAQRAAGDNGTGSRHGRTKSVVSTGPGDHEGRVEPPSSGVLVVREKVTSTVGFAL